MSTVGFWCTFDCWASLISPPRPKRIDLTSRLFSAYALDHDNVVLRRNDLGKTYCQPDSTASDSEAPALRVSRQALSSYTECLLGTTVLLLPRKSERNDSCQNHFDPRRDPKRHQNPFTLLLRPSGHKCTRKDTNHSSDSSVSWPIAFQMEQLWVGRQCCIRTRVHSNRNLVPES